MIMPYRYAVVWVFGAAMLSSCGIFEPLPPLDTVDNKQAKLEQTLGDVYFEPLPLQHDPLAQPDTQTLRDAYKALLEVVTDPNTQQIAQYRLADLEGLVAEQKQEAGLPLEVVKIDKTSEKLFDATIQQYQQLLADHPQNPDNIEVLYQLAKAYEQQGQMQQSFDTLQQLLKRFPDNPYLAETYFRMGEVKFNQRHYSSAVTSYVKVLQQGEQSAYYPTAAYMLGWSYFKDEQQNEALKAFSLLLDYSLPNQVISQAMLAQVDSQGQIDRLPVGEKRLVTDTIRIMSLLFSYQDSTHTRPAGSVAHHFDQIGAKHYEYVLYDALAQHYLNKDRYRDSATAYETFSQLHPNHFQAPIFAVKQIDAYILGKFPSLVLPAKQAFVLRYGIDGEFWSQWPFVVQEQVAPYLNEYLQELAQFEHSRGQMLTNAGLAETKQEKGDKVPTTQMLQKQGYAAFMLAAKWYQQFIDTFPYDRQTAELTFRLGETLFEAKEFSQAIRAFEIYAYEHLRGDPRKIVANDKAAEAGYMGLLAFRQIQRSTDTFSLEEKANWLDKQLNSQEKFVQYFAEDPRAIDVLFTQVQQLFVLKRYELAITGAQQLLDWQPQATAEKLLASHLVIGHSQFALQQYAVAETKYDQIIRLLPTEDLRRADMIERLAASIYKQGEQKVSDNYLPLAVTDFLRVLAKTPGSAIRVNAQYDAATYLFDMREWQQSIALLEDFRVRFPKHELTINIADKLIQAYQQNEDWQQAADELLVLHQAGSESEQGRQALYVAAQYLYKIGNTQKALETYRIYAHSYAQPFAEANEARFIMSEFYRKSNEVNKRQFWLKKLIQADNQALKDASIERSDRSRYLAAMASTIFADDKLYAYKKIKLTQPLKSSLAKKKSALNIALKAYNDTLAYKVSEFSTLANFSIADIYHQLAKDLMTSSKPKDLNPLELEQYVLLLEEQAYPFEEKAIDIHETNAQRSWKGSYDKWVQSSFTALEKLLPGRYNKKEQSMEVVDEVY
jgi:tetratricopeptide (TPR) repeat protein